MKIFLSSTCYDLTDLRAIVEDYFKKKGEILLLSDRNSFPINPREHRHDICLLNAKSADLFLLFLDKRFGAPYYKDKNISITWAEYRIAKENNVPIFVLIRENVFNERETWKVNGRKDDFKPAFTDKVETFKFIDEIQLANEGPWIGQFNNAVDVLEKMENLSMSNNSKITKSSKTNEFLLNVFMEVLNSVTISPFGNIVSAIIR